MNKPNLIPISSVVFLNIWLNILFSSRSLLLPPSSTRPHIYVTWWLLRLQCSILFSWKLTHSCGLQISSGPCSHPLSWVGPSSLPVSAVWLHGSGGLAGTEASVNVSMSSSSRSVLGELWQSSCWGTASVPSPTVMPLHTCQCQLSIPRIFPSNWRWESFQSSALPQGMHNSAAEAFPTNRKH